MARLQIARSAKQGARGTSRSAILLPPAPRSWHPALIGRTAEQIWASALDEPDYMLTLAREHGYADGAAMKRAAHERPDPVFEQCVEAVIDGDVLRLDLL